MTTEDPINPPARAPERSTSRRRWLRLIVALIVVNVVVLLGILLWTLSSVGRVDIDDPPVAPPPTAAPTEEPPSGEGPLGESPPTETLTGDTPVAEPAERITFLVMGSDSRQDLPADLGVTDDQPGYRADVIMIAALDGDRIRILSLPRDLRVDVEGVPRKLNAAYSVDGPNPSLLFNTVEKETGIDIDYYVELDFFGFASIVDQLGGVEITFPYRARDLKSHLDVEAGRQHLDGKTALAYARSRQYEEYRGGTWVTVDGNDLGRIRRQQSLLFAMLSATKRLSAFDVFRVLGVLRAVGQHVRVDSRLAEKQLVDLILAGRDLENEDIEIVALPVRESQDDGVYYLVADHPAAEAVFRSFRASATGSAAEQPSGESLMLKVLNGNGGSGQANLWSDRLEDHGFVVVQVDDAASFDFEGTVVTVRPGDFESGRRIVDALGFGQVEPGSVSEGLDAVVIVGVDALGR